MGAVTEIPGSTNVQPPLSKTKFFGNQPYSSCYDKRQQSKIHYKMFTLMYIAILPKYTTHNKLKILGLIFVQFIYLIFLVTEIFVTAKMSDYDQNKTLDMKIQHLLDVRNYTRSRTPPNWKIIKVNIECYHHEHQWQLDSDVSCSWLGYWSCSGAVHSTLLRLRHVVAIGHVVVGHRPGDAS